jgi:hypothetical protein
LGREECSPKSVVTLLAGFAGARPSPNPAAVRPLSPPAGQKAFSEEAILGASNAVGGLGPHQPSLDEGQPKIDALIYRDEAVIGDSLNYRGGLCLLARLA